MSGRKLESSLRAVGTGLSKQKARLSARFFQKSRGLLFRRTAPHFGRIAQLFQFGCKRRCKASKRCIAPAALARREVLAARRRGQPKPASAAPKRGHHVHGLRRVRAALHHPQGAAGQEPHQGPPGAEAQHHGRRDQCLVSRRSAVLRRLHAVDARRLRERRPWVVSFPILGRFLLSAHRRGPSPAF